MVSDSEALREYHAMDPSRDWDALSETIYARQVLYAFSDTPDEDHPYSTLQDPWGAGFDFGSCLACSAPHGGPIAILSDPARLTDRSGRSSQAVGDARRVVLYTSSRRWLTSFIVRPFLNQREGVV